MSVATVDFHEFETLSPSLDRKSKSRAEEIQAKDEAKKWKILLEPALAGAMIAINLGQTSLQNFYLRTACTVDLKYPHEICDRGVGEEFREAEAASQMLVSRVNVSRSFVGSLIATVILLFVGPWSDYSGRRKPLLILPLLGMSVMTTAVLLMVTFPGASTVQVLYAVQIPISLGGNFGLLLAAAFSYIGDVCHSTGRDATRAMGAHRAAIQAAHVLGAVGGPLLYRRLGFYGVFPVVLLLQVLASIQAAHVLGAMGGPLLYRRLGFYGVFPVVLLLQVSSLIYIVVTVKDVSVNAGNTTSVFSWRLPVAAVRCLVRRRAGSKRAAILLMLLVALGDRMFLSAEVLIAYMYYRYKFHWDDVLFGGFLAYRNIVSFTGTLIILLVLKRRLRLSDEAVGALSCASCALASSGLVAASSTLAVFMVPLVGIISQGSQVVQRPILNKQIFPNEQGKIYSVLGALESATQILSSPLYSLLYSKTVSTLPDAWLLPGIVLAIIQLLAYLVTRRLSILSANTTLKKNIPLVETGESEKLRKDDEDITTKEPPKEPPNELNKLQT